MPFLLSIVTLGVRTYALCDLSRSVLYTLSFIGIVNVGVTGASLSLLFVTPDTPSHFYSGLFSVC